jgi:hypothetical protein
VFDDVPKFYRLDLVSSTAFSNGTVGLQYRPAPLDRRPTCTTSGNQASATTCPRGPWPNANQPAILADGDRLCDLLKEYGLGVNTVVRPIEEVET